MPGNISPIEALVHRRRGLGLSQHAVADRAGLTQTYLSKIERGKVDPRLSTLADIARAESMELILVPQDLVVSVRALLGQGPRSDERPLFTAEPD